jgi:hypothetical protein
MKCQICQEHADQVVIFKKEQNAKAGYLVIDDRVVFETDKIAKFLYFCETKGLHLKARGILDLCENCLRGARITMN